MKPPSRDVVLELPDVEATRQLGEKLGRLLAVGHVVALVGPLGSGKTTFAQGIARGLEVPTERHVASPTFALVNEHPGRVPFLHADFYRVAREEELAELGLEEAYDRAAAALEWADRFPQIIPADHLEITLAPVGEGSRRATLRAQGPRSAALLAAVAAS
jgi:tRNA threonylcarbamoyladenosine biosynthesis protein TsaE